MTRQLPTVEGFLRLFEEFDKAPRPYQPFTGEHGACALGVLALRDGLVRNGTPAGRQNNMVIHDLSINYGKSVTLLAAGFDDGVQGLQPPNHYGTDLAAYNLGYEVGATLFNRHEEAALACEPEPVLV